MEEGPGRETQFFVYNAFGQLLRWQDGRGVTNAYGYDLAGRLVSEDYGDDGSADVRYHFDAPASSIPSITSWYGPSLRCNAFDPLSCLLPYPQQNLLGQISAIEDRSGTTIFSYDDDGNAAWVERQVSMFTRDESEPEFSRKDDHSQIWHWGYAYDELGRITLERYPEEGVSTALTYSERGLVTSASMTSPAWTSPQPVIDGVAYNELGQVLDVDFGDGADLHLSKRYKALKQLERLVYTQVFEWDEVGRLAEPRHDVPGSTVRSPWG